MNQSTTPQITLEFACLQRGGPSDYSGIEAKEILINPPDSGSEVPCGRLLFVAALTELLDGSRKVIVRLFPDQPHLSHFHEAQHLMGQLDRRQERGRTFFGAGTETFAYSTGWFDSQECVFRYGFDNPLLQFDRGLVETLRLITDTQEMQRLGMLVLKGITLNLDTVFLMTLRREVIRCLGIGYAITQDFSSRKPRVKQFDPVSGYLLASRLPDGTIS